MKKIIYSLVIMIAAGSLFTSCIEPIEPAGIYGLREAKARYYDALSKLRAADALYREAQADHEKAMAEYQRALTENQNLLNYYQQLVNEAKELANEKEVEKWKLEIEALLKQREIDRINWEVAVAQAEENRRQALSWIEMAMLDLTTAEKTALNNALGLYNNALKDYHAKELAVYKADSALWNAKYEYENQKYGGINTGLDLVEYYEALVAMDELNAAWYEALLEEFEENSDVAEWVDDLEELKAELEEEKYSRHEVTVDSVLFMEGVFHEANIQFGLEVDKWIEENEGVAAPEAPGAEPTQAQYPASKYFIDSIAFPVFEYKASPAYDKFVSLLVGVAPTFNENYAAVTSLVPDTLSHSVMTWDATEETITIIANYNMKDFVLGSETPTTDSLEMTYYDKETKKDKTVKAKWGLEGALSVLKRDKVLADETGKTQEEKEKEAEDALKLWTADRDSILLLYAAKKASDPVAEAYKPLKDAMDALEDAKDEAESESGSLVKAAEKLAETLNGMINHADMSRADSSKLVEAFVEFAKTRAAYLAYTPYKNGTEYDNKDLFYYSVAVTPTHIVDSVAFTDLTLEMIDKTKAFEYKADGTQITTPKVAAFLNIAQQLFGAGSNMAKGIENFGASNPYYPVAATDLNNDGFYGAYKYVAGTPAATIHTVSPDAPYTPKEVTDAEALVATEVTALNNLWDRFWKENLGATATAGVPSIPVLDDKYNPDCYTLSTFTSPYNVVIFNGTNIVWTEAIGDILGSVDPKKDPNYATGANFKDASGNVKTNAAVFYGANGETDFYQYMYKLAQTKSPSTTDIQAIEEWIGKVKKAFADFLTEAETKATGEYNTAHSTWATKKATYDEKKPLYDAYIEKLKAFVGTDEDGNLINVTTVGGVKVPSLKAIAAPVKYEATQVKQTQVAPFQYEGEWDAEEIGGKQKEIADKLFVDEDGNTYPELLAAWRSEAETREDKIGHLEQVIEVVEDALLSACAVMEGTDLATLKAALIGDPTDPDYDPTVEGYFEYVIDYLEGRVAYWLAQATIDEKALAKAKAGYDASQIVIFELEQKLEYAKAELAEAAAKLAAAEEYYNTVIAHIYGEN